jgi:hypothetical protein
MRQEPIDPAVKTAIRADMARFGYRSVMVEPGLDYDGDPVIWIDVHYEDSNDPVDTKAMADLVPKISRLVRTLGEDRFPHIRHDVCEDRSVMATH